MKYFIFAYLLVFSAVSNAETLREQFLKSGHSTPLIRDKSRSNDEVSSDKHGIQQVMVETSACFGNCPEYSISISADGMVEYIGYKNVEFIGSRIGHIDNWRIRPLFQFINDSKYFSMQYEYKRGITDHSSVYTMVKKASGESKIIRNYANSGPSSLWAIEELVEATAKNAKWQDQQNKN